ncbi:hypothetical protein BDN70DRAFT_940177, partial [Pholiota conissans]
MPGTTRADSIVESSSDTNSVVASPYFRVPLAANCASDVPQGSAKTPGSEETSRLSQAQDAEQARNRAQQMRSGPTRGAGSGSRPCSRIELEDTLKSVEAELSSKAKTLDALTISSDEIQSQIHSLEVDLQKAVSISKNVEEERDRALSVAREANDAQVASKDALNEAQSR